LAIRSTVVALVTSVGLGLVGSASAIGQPTVNTGSYRNVPLAQQRIDEFLRLKAHSGGLTQTDKSAIDAWLREWGKGKKYYYYASTSHGHTAEQTQFARVIAGYLSALGYSHVYVKAEPGGMGKWGIPAGKVQLTFEH